MTWLRAHWIPLLMGLAVGAPAAWLLRPNPQPAVTLHTDSVDKKSEQKDVAKKDAKAPIQVVRRTFRTDCPPGSPQVVASETVTQRGPEVITTDTRARSEEQLEQHTDLRITPASPPRWALGAGVEDPLGARRVTLTAGMRLLGPVWLRAAAAPSRGFGGMTVGAEVQW